MRNLILPLATALLLLFCLALPSNAQAVQNEPALSASALPQAEPVYNLLKAVEVSDFNLYQSVWTSETLKMYRERKRDWSRIRREYRKMFREDVGRYRLEDLRFYFRKDYDFGAGVVFIVYKGERRTGFNVIEENGKWKIREM